MGTDDLLVDAEVAKILRISVGTLRNKVSSDSALPPYIQAPGSRLRLWSREALYLWLAGHTHVNAGEQAEVRARKGRPTKRTARRRKEMERISSTGQLSGANADG